MILVDGVQVPVVWSPSDLRGGDSDGHPGRFRFGKSGANQVIRALVYHRIVGTLETTVNQTFYPTTDDLMTKGERRVSAHFSLGRWGSTGLRVVQHVALEDTAYCNGQTLRDKAACTWPLWIAAGRPDANGMTVSFEHEDNAAAGNYFVTEDIIRLSIELTRLLLSGDGKAIRAAGIRCSDVVARQLGAIVPSRLTLVPHVTIAPVTKPYCWVAYKGGNGFPQARYVAALTASQEEPMGLALTLDATRAVDPASALTAFGRAVVMSSGTPAAIRLRDMSLAPMAPGTSLGTVQTGALNSPLEAQRGRPAVAGNRTSIVAFNMSGEAFVMLASDVSVTPFVAVDLCPPRIAAALEKVRGLAMANVGNAVDTIAAQYTEVVPHG